MTACAYGAWAKTYRLRLLLDLWSLLSLGVPRSSGGRQFRLVLQYRSCFAVVLPDRVLQHLTRDPFLQETRDLGAPFLTILLLRFSLSATSLGRSSLGSVLDLGWSISGSEPPVGVLLSVLGQGSSGLGLPDLPFIVR